jgi:hypothetical protein
MSRSNIFARIIEDLSDPENGIVATWNEEDQCIDFVAPKLDSDMLAVFEGEELRIISIEPFSGIGPRMVDGYMVMILWLSMRRNLFH